MLSKSYQKKLRKAMLQQIKEREIASGESLQSCKQCLDDPKKERMPDKAKESQTIQKTEHTQSKEHQEIKQERGSVFKKANIIKGREEIKMVMNMVKKGKEDARKNQQT